MSAGDARRGRRPGANPTRQQVLDAARATFAARGFRGTTIRMVAEAAQVDPGLVHHYFTSKRALFAATAQFPDHAAPQVLDALQSEAGSLAERLTRAYLGLWEDPSTRDQMKIVTKSALVNDDAMANVRPAIMGVVAQVASALPGPDPEIRFQLAMAHLFGVASVRYITTAPPLSDLLFDELVDRITPAIEVHLAIT